jgi:predicted AAA+ superfamily ATPase
MEPWYKVATPRKEVREGRSFNPDEFAIALEQVVAGTAPEDYRKPDQFFARTCFTRALREHAGMILRRLSGKTENTAPVLTLITQFGGGKTHTLTTLYHLAKHGEAAADYQGVADLVREAGITSVPKAKVAVFVGNAWDPRDGRETPWIDIARQLAGDKGIEALGAAAKTTPPGTEAIGRTFEAAGAPVLLLFDEVLNFLNRHRAMADSFHAFIHNLTVATTGTTQGACVISLPRSQVEMTDWDQEWQEKISRVVRRVAKDLIANDETEISEVVRRRLFQDLGSERIRKNVAKAFGDWCFERRAQLPPEWTAVDSAATEARAREFLQRRFEACYPFHPATLSVFQRKWQSLPQYQQTRGTLAMLAQWISLAAQDAFRKARTEPLITLGSAPMAESGFRSVVLGQLGESRLVAAIDTDIAGEQAHSKALDADTKGPLRDIHRRVGTAILFESSGGQSDKVAHLPELRFALGEPELDTTTIDNAAWIAPTTCARRDRTDFGLAISRQ